jgi:hypothetical protein
MCNMIVDAMKKCTSSNIFEKLLIMAKDPEGRAGHKTQIRCPDWGAEGREIQTFEGQHNIYFCPVYTGAVCPVPAPRRVRCRAGLVTPRFRYLMIESWFSGTLSVARGRPSWFPREICVAGGAPPESGLASSLAGLYRVGASTRWCGWVKVKR